MADSSAPLRLDLNCVPGIQEEEDPPGDVSLQQHSQQARIIPDLELNMQALSLSAPAVCNLEAGQAEQNQEIQETYMLLMKVACTAGSPRVISEHTIRQAMARAWRQHFYAISQVSTNLFMAYFSTQEDRMFVYTRQPWMMGSDNLLLEWVDPNDEDKTREDYKFDHIYVTVRAYGVPKEARSLKLLKDILQTVGEPSEFHPLQSNMIFSREEYIWGMAKLKVMQKVIDKISLTLPDKSTTMVYLHYEKIGRICLFCGIMFHNVQHCPIRNELIMERTKYNMPVNDIPFVRFGEWLLDPNLIPQQTIRPRKEGTSVLSRFQKMFSDEAQGKSSIQGKTSNTSVFYLPANYQLVKENQVQTQQAVNLQVLERLQRQRNISQGSGVTNESAQRLNPHTEQIHSHLISTQSLAGKRAPSQYLLQETPATKRCAQDGGNQRVQQQYNSSEIHDTPMQNIARTGEVVRYETAEGDQIQFGYQNDNLQGVGETTLTLSSVAKDPVVDTIAGAEGENAEANQEVANLGRGGTNTMTIAKDQIVSGNQGGEHWRKISGWDVRPTNGSGEFISGDPKLPFVGSGGPIRNRHYLSKKMSNQNRMCKDNSSIKERTGSPYPYSHSRSPARVESIGGEDYEPWPIRTPSPSSSTGSLGSKYGAFSPPKVVDNRYKGMDAHVDDGGTEVLTKVQGQVRANNNDNGDAFLVSETHLEGNMEVDGAMAPALKAPRVP